MATNPAVPESTAPVAPLQQGSEIEVPDGTGKTKKVAIADRIEVYELTETIQSLINAGRIIVDENVVVKIDEAYVVYTQLLATDLDSMTALVGAGLDAEDKREDLVSLVTTVKEGKVEVTRGKPSVASKFNYGNDLDAKREVRQKYEKRVAGPAKTVNKTIDLLVQLGYSKEEAEALSKAKLPTA